MFIRPMRFAAFVMLGLMLAVSSQPALAEATTQPATSEAAKHRQSQYNLDGKHVALSGYDPVSYMNKGGPTKGNPKFSASFNGVTYHFASDANLKAFEAAPQKYEPAYGGWCAYAMGKSGEKVQVDPRSYEIEEGRLFVFYKDLLTDTRKLWAKDRDDLLPAADKQWHDQAGEAAPLRDFTLEPAIGDTPFTLSNARGQYVALHFLLKTECPYCIRHTHNYTQRRDEVQGVQQVFVKPDTMADIQQWTRKLGDDDVRAALVYRDADASLANRLDIPDGYKFHGQIMHYPALLIIDPAGREVFRYVGKSNGDRFSFDQFKEKMAELRGE